MGAARRRANPSSPNPDPNNHKAAGTLLCIVLAKTNEEDIPLSASAMRGLALLMFPAWVGAASFTPLSNPSGGYNLRIGVGISADGSTVVGSGFTAAGSEAIRWVNGGSPQGLGFMAGGNESYAVATSADGSVIVGRGDALQGASDPQPGNVSIEGFRWTQAGGMQSLGYLPLGGSYAVANGVSADGSVIAGYSDGPASEMAYRWTQFEALQPIGALPYGGSQWSQANAISGDGVVIVGESSGTFGLIDGRQAFRWTISTGISALTPLARSASTTALGVSADGSVIVGNSFISSSSCLDCVPPVVSRNNAVSWTNQGAPTLLGQVPGGDYGSSARAVAADGSVVVGMYQVDPDDPLTGFRAFVWTAGSGMQKLFDVLLLEGATGLSGWTLLQATGVSADGRTIAGYGLNPLGQPQAFLATIADMVPNPFSFISQGDIPLSTVRDSNIVTITGIDAVTPISVVGGSYSINAGPFMIAASTVTDSDTVTVRQTSSALPATTTSATLTIGGIDGIFTVTTLPVDTTPEPFSFTNQANVALSTVITSNAIAVTGINTATSISVTGGSYSIGCGATFINGSSTISNGQTVCLQQTSAANNSTNTITTLTIGGGVAQFTTRTIAAVGGGGGGGALDGFSLLALGLLGLMRRKISG